MLRCAALQLQLQYHYHYTCTYNCTTRQPHYNSNSNYTTLQLHHTTSSRCASADHCNHSKKHNSNHFSVHQWVRSATHAWQQLTCHIGFLSLKLPPPPCAVLRGIAIKKEENTVWDRLRPWDFWSSKFWRNNPWQRNFETTVRSRTLPQLRSQAFMNSKTIPKTWHLLLSTLSAWMHIFLNTAYMCIYI